MREVDLYSAAGRKRAGAGKPDSLERKRREGDAVDLLTQKLEEQKEAALDATQKAALLTARLESSQRQLQTAQQEMEAQKQARASDSARMAWTLSRLQQEKTVAANHALEDHGTLSKQRDMWRAAAAAGLVGLCLLCMIGWRMNAVAPKGHAAALVSAEPARKGNALPANPSPSDQGAALNAGIDHLNDALDAVPGRSAQQILRDVSTHGKNCKIVWTGDLPSLLFTGKSLAGMLEDCAQAVWRVHH